MKPLAEEVIKRLVSNSQWCIDCLGKERRPEDCLGCPVDRALKAIIYGGVS